MSIDPDPAPADDPPPDVEDGGGDDEGDYGVPFPGALVPAERRTDARATLPRRGRVDWGALFGRTGARRVVDLGCGNGRFLVGSALAHPDFDHLGVDLVPQAIEHAARRAGERGLTNVRFAWGDAGALVRFGLEPQSLDELHCYHPQPYYDRNKVERRLLTPEVFFAAWSVLRPGGRLVLQTDNAAYWRYLRTAVRRLFLWRVQQGPWPDTPEGRTRREILARQKELRIYRGTGVPRPLCRRTARAIAAHIPRPAFDANRPEFRDP